VGIADADPWTIPSEDPPSGIEVELIEGLAEELDAEIEWTTGAEHELFGALELGELDLVAGGLDATSPYAQEAALTHPYVTTQIVVGFPADDAGSTDIAARKVAVERNTEAAGLLEQTDADPVPVNDVAEAEGLIAVDDWLLSDLDLEDRGVGLHESDHVMAVRLGENGWMTTVERYLLENAETIESLLEQETP
jgi:polar amino acid transport system substrate-binding protein